MKRLFKYSLCLLLLLVSISVSARNKTTERKKVYMFGFAASFVDSVAYMTDIMEVDSAYVLPNGFLGGRAFYSIQLYGHVNEKRGVENPTAAVFFDVKPKKVAKKFQKVKRNYMQHPTLKLVMIGQDEFRFTREEYEEQLIMEEEVVAPEEKKGKKSKAKKGGKA